MKIKETVERECCNANKDLIPLNIMWGERAKFYFCCRHCFSMWQDKGGSEPEDGLTKLPFPWEEKT